MTTQLPGTLADRVRGQVIKPGDDAYEEGVVMRLLQRLSSVVVIVCLDDGWTSESGCRSRRCGGPGCRFRPSPS